MEWLSCAPAPKSTDKKIFHSCIFSRLQKNDKNTHPPPPYERLSLSIFPHIQTILMDDVLPNSLQGVWVVSSPILIYGPDFKNFHHFFTLGSTLTRFFSFLFLILTAPPYLTQPLRLAIPLCSFGTIHLVVFFGMKHFPFSSRPRPRDLQYTSQPG